MTKLKLHLLVLVYKKLLFLLEFLSILSQLVVYKQGYQNSDCSWHVHEVPDALTSVKQSCGNHNEFKLGFDVTF